MLSIGALRDRIVSLSAELELPRYSPASIRGCYMTAANKAVSELGMGSEAERAASDHIDPATGPLHYIRHEDREYYEALCGIEIGTAKIRGVLTPERPEGLSESDEVAIGFAICELSNSEPADLLSVTLPWLGLLPLGELNGFPNRLEKRTVSD
ncbi:MAG: hypothetical protein ACI36Y_07180 [Coriobacteriales bacterium]